MRKPTPPAIDDGPLTPEEIAESKRLAGLHRNLVLLALFVGDIKPRPSRRNRVRNTSSAKSAATPAIAPEAIDTKHATADFIQTISRHCPRPDCRRAFRCCHGTRHDEHPSDQATRSAKPSCLTRLPKPAIRAAELALHRLHDPKRFRDPGRVDDENETIAEIRIELDHTMERKRDNPPSNRALPR